MKLTISIMLVVFGLLGASRAEAGSPRIERLEVALDESAVEIACVFKGGITPEVHKSIMAGIPARIRFEIDLLRERSFWFNERVAQATIEHEVRYDPLAEKFEVLIGENGAAPPLVAGSFKEARRKFISLKRFRLPLPESFDLEKPYIVRTRARVEIDENPEGTYPETILFFLKRRTIETNWQSATIREGK